MVSLNLQQDPFLGMITSSIAVFRTRLIFCSSFNDFLNEVYQQMFIPANTGAAAASIWGSEFVFPF